MILPFSTSRSRTSLISKPLYWASLTPRAMFSKSMNRASLRSSLRSSFIRDVPSLSYGGVNSGGEPSTSHTHYTPGGNDSKRGFLGRGELLRSGPDFLPLDAGGVHLEGAVPVGKDYNLDLLTPLPEQTEGRLLDAEVYGVEPQWRGRLEGAVGSGPPFGLEDGHEPHQEKAERQEDREDDRALHGPW